LDAQWAKIQARYAAKAKVDAEAAKALIDTNTNDTTTKRATDDTK
jgi:hypothetical protein